MCGYTVSMAEKQKKERVILLDSHAIIHRAYHALPEFVSSKGEPTGALYGLVTMLIRIINDLKPDYIIACYDLPQKTFRHVAYDGYKAGRAKTDDALVAQLISSRNLFEAFSIPIYDAPGFEADDILGTIVDQLKKKKNTEVIIASGDMDTLQLVSGRDVQVFTLKKGLNDTILYDEQSVLERFGFVPKLLPDYKGLRGDPSDNIIGIAGIGEKTATTLITEFGTLENLYAVLKKNPNKVKASGITDRILTLLKEGEEEALFSKTLATIRPDAPIVFEYPKVTFQENVSLEKVDVFFREHEFKTLLERFKRSLGKGSEPETKDDPKKTTKNSEPKSEVVVDPDIFKRCAIGLWLLNSDVTNPTLEDILHFENSADIADAQKNIENALKKNGLWYMYESVELPLIPIISKMQVNGICIDIPYLEKLSKEYHKELDILEKSIYMHAGREFNVNSPKQLGEILFDEMKLQDQREKSATTRMKKTAGGARSTKESELEKLRGIHPVIDDLFKYRELQKLLSTYIDTLPKLVGADGRIHAEFNQAGSTTGRFSSHNPSLQNIPIKSELGKNIRNAFIAPKGMTLLALDYSQIELRVAAFLSGDTYLSQVFIDGKDVHAAVASRVFGVPESEVTSEMRRRAKVINFGILYGMGVNALKQNLGTDRKDAQLFYDNYFLQFPTIQAYLDGVISFAKEHGYTETLFGRKRFFPGIKSKIPFIKAMAERMAINAPIQGTAADVMKLAMIAVDIAIKKNGLENSVKLLLQVHDELIFEVSDSVVTKAKELLTEAMQDVIPVEYVEGKQAIPLTVEAETGATWGTLKS